jgi:hypothetical protein
MYAVAKGPCAEADERGVLAVWSSGVMLYVMLCCQYPVRRVARSCKLACRQQQCIRLLLSDGSSPAHTLAHSICEAL